MTDIPNYDQLRAEAIQWYSRIGRIPSPVFNNEPVFFTSEGFNHLIYKNARSERNKEEQVARFKLLGNAVKLVRITTTFQEFDESIKQVTVKRFKRKITESKIVKHWGLIAIMGTWKIRVIIRQISGGQKHFWSVIPNWTTSQFRDIKYLTNMKGNPEED